jgi:hypothetical protein
VLRTTIWHPILDGEVAAISSFTIPASIASRPVPLRFLVEDHITRDGDSPSDRIISPVRLCATLVPNKDHLPPPIIELLQVWLGVTHIDDATESLEVVDRWRLPILDLKWCLAIICLARHPVQEIHDGHHRLPPKPAGQTLRLDHTPCSSDYHGIAVRCSTTPFCWGEYAAVSCRCTPSAMQ